jgi:hypothetical protein
MKIENRVKQSREEELANRPSGLRRTHVTGSANASYLLTVLPTKETVRAEFLAIFPEDLFGLRDCRPGAALIRLAVAAEAVRARPISEEIEHQTQHSPGQSNQRRAQSGSESSALVITSQLCTFRPFRSTTQIVLDFVRASMPA